MKLKTCTECARQWPARLVHMMTSSDPYSDGQSLDPICALRLRNELHGLPKGTPFDGPMAKQFHFEAVTYATAKGWPVE